MKRTSEVIAVKVMPVEESKKVFIGAHLDDALPPPMHASRTVCGVLWQWKRYARTSSGFWKVWCMGGATFLDTGYTRQTACSGPWSARIKLRSRDLGVCCLLPSILLSSFEAMSSSDQNPAGTPASGSAEPAPPPGGPTSVSSQALDMGAQMVQALKPVKQMKQHACSFALYSHDPGRQLEVHHFVSRLNQDVLQCAVYDSDKPSARLIGVEYIVSDAIFERLPPEEQRLWHSHAYEVKAGLWTDLGVPEALQRSEMASLAKTYGKFWCTWQVDRGDAMPLGAPALMVSPQAVDPGRARADLVAHRDERYRVDSSAEGLKADRVEMDEPEWINPNADYWRMHGKGFAVDVVPAEMKRHAPFP